VKRAWKGRYQSSNRQKHDLESAGEDMIVKEYATENTTKEYTMITDKTREFRLTALPFVSTPPQSLQAG